MVLYAVIILVSTALFQLLGAFLTWLSLKRLQRHHNAILVIEIVIMFLISAEIIFLSARKSLVSLFGVVAGLALVYLLNRFVPHKHECEFERLGLLVFTAMCIHELPEGVAFGSTYLLNPKLGLLTAALIALHNLPEGSICAMPYLMKNKLKQAFTLTIITQLLYIAGGLGAFFLLVSLSQTVQALSANLAAGAMIFIAFEEIKFLK
jgi:zinc transporter ZupT